MNGVQGFIDRVDQFIITPLVVLLTTTAVLLFAWGLIQFLFNSENEEARTKGRKHMMWAFLGLLVIFLGIAFVRVVLMTFGVDPAPNTGF